MTDAEKLREVAKWIKHRETLGQTGAEIMLLQIATKLDRLHDREWVGRIMHESWSQTKRKQGFHHDRECPRSGMYRCDKCHADLIPWDDLPEAQKDINRHALDAVLEAPERP